MKRLLESTMVFILILLVVGCSKQEAENKPDVRITNEKDPNNGQEYSVINTLNLYDSYLNKVTDDLKRDEIG